MRGTALGTFLLAGTMLTSAPASAAINAAEFGLSESASDNAAALQRAFDAAKPGEEVIIPSGKFAYSRQLKVDGIKVRGSGNTVLAPTNPENQRFLVTGNSPSVSNMKIDYKPIMRNGAEHGRNGVWVEKATNFNVSGLVMDGQAYGTPEKGGGGNIFIYKSTGGTIRNNTVKFAQADSIHITSGSKDIDVTGNRIVGSNDDGIAVVNYRDGAGNVRISGNTVTGNRWGRNITAVGASDVKITNNFIDGNAADGAGIYVASEPRYKTAAPKNVQIENNVIQDTGGTGKGHGQIMLWSGNAGQVGPIDGVSIKNNEVRDSKRDDLAVVISGQTNNVTLEGNRIDGEVARRNGGGFEGSGNTTNDPQMANSAAVPAGTPALSGIGGRPEESPLDRNLDRLADNASDTDEQFWRAVERGEASALRRLNDLVSAGILVRQGNAVINRITGQVTSTTNRAIGSAVDAVMDPVEDTVQGVGQAVSCSIGGSIVSGAAGLAGAMFGGGRATLGAQISQYLAQTAANMCHGKQLNELKKMTAGLEANAAAGVRGIEESARSTLGSVDEALYGSGADEAFQERYQQGMPEDWDFENSAEHMKTMRQQTDLATREAAAVHAATKESLEEALAVSDETLALSQGAEGQTQAIQAQTQMMRSLIGVQAVTQTAEAASQTAALRTAEEQRAQEIIADQKIQRFYGPGSLEPRTVTGRALFQ